MKIIHVAEAFEGGIIEIMRLLSNHLPEFEHIIVYGNRNIDTEKEKTTFPANVRFINWHSAKREISFRDDIKAFRELKKILKENMPFDAMHLYSSKAGFLGRITGKSLGIKNILYSPQGASFERQDISGLKKKIYGFLEKSASLLPGKIIASSKSEQKCFEDLGIHAACINNGVSLDVNFKKEFPEQVFTIVNSARISEQKNPSLFNSIAEAFVNNPRVKFVWVGEGPLRNELTAPNISITGWVGKEEVEKNLKIA
ncbi:MAG: glycosyl transferase family 1, partial [Chitinophagaceae bacterium]